MTSRLAVSLLTLACACVPRPSEAPPADEHVSTPAHVPVELRELAPGVWLHTSFEDLPELGLFPSNGLLVHVDDQLVLIDTAWTDAQTREIAEWAARTLGVEIDALIVTHAHGDKMGGVKALNELGVRTLALAITNEAAKTRDLVPTRETLPLDADDSARLAGGAIEVFYPGPGHTDDNVVVYLRDAKLLFGGCMIRPGESDSLGNTADADVGHWDEAVRRVLERYPDAITVVPSHGAPGGPELLRHTIELVLADRAAAAER